jgi:hypothetical protein
MNKSAQGVKNRRKRIFVVSNDLANHVGGLHKKLYLDSRKVRSRLQYLTRYYWIMQISASQT